MEGESGEQVGGELESVTSTVQYSTGQDIPNPNPNSTFRQTGRLMGD